MEFYDLLKQYKDFDFETLWANTTEDQILRINQINKNVRVLVRTGGNVATKEELSKMY